MNDMKWKKLGLIFCPEGNQSWMLTHASTPFVQPIGDDLYRVFFSTRDAQNQSSITWLDLNISPEPHVISVSDTPSLNPGMPGFFDDSGVTMSQIIRYNDRDYLYYIGWNLATKMPFRNSIGLATAPAGTPLFIKHSLAPIMDRDAIDPISLSYPWIIIENGVWRMWYGSHTSVEKNNLDVEHVIKYAESKDGMHWERRGHVCIALKEGESGVVRPCVMKDEQGYHMWYSVRIGRKETYRMGYAISADGIDWERHDDEVGISTSEERGAWDHEMICYPCVFEHNGQRYMLYNGNSFGRTGFGIAQRIDTYDI